MAVKRYAVDYWVDPNAKGDPARTDYANDEQTLVEAAPNSRRYDGEKFRCAWLYERIKDTGHTEKDWSRVRQIPLH